MDIMLRKLPTRQTLRDVASYVPACDMSKLEGFISCVRKLSEIYQTIEDNLGRFGLSLGRFGVLVMLLTQEGEGMTPSELADRGGIKRASVTGLLAGLETDGLIERLKDPADRRISHVRLTAKGRNLITLVLPIHFERVNGLLADLTPDEIDQAASLFEKLRIPGSPPDAPLT